MKTKSEKQTLPPCVQTQVVRSRGLLEEAIFLGNSFFLMGQNLPGKSSKNKVEVEADTVQKNEQNSLQKK